MELNCFKATEPLRGDSFLLTIQFLGFQEFLLLNWSSSEGWKTDLTLKPPSGYEPGIPGVGNQGLNH